MIITIDTVAFHTANACRADNDRRYRFVVLSPDGAVYGTDGYRASHHAKGCVPFHFELPRGTVLAVRPTGKVPVTATNLALHVDVDDDQKGGHLRYTRGGKQTGVLCDIDIIDSNTYPDIQAIVPTHGQKYNSDLLGLNFGLAVEIAQALHTGGKVGVIQFAPRNGVLMFETKSPDHVVMLAPCHVSGDVMRPLPLQEETDE